MGVRLIIVLYLQARLISLECLHNPPVNASERSDDWDSINLIDCDKEPEGQVQK